LDGRLVENLVFLFPKLLEDYLEFITSCEYRSSLIKLLLDLLQLIWYLMMILG